MDRGRDNLAPPDSRQHGLVGGSPRAGPVGRLLPADTAMEFGVEYASVVAFGTVRLLTESAEATRALQFLLDRYFPHMKPGEDYRQIIPEEPNSTAV